MAWALRPLAAGRELGEEGERSEGELGPRQGLNLSGRLLRSRPRIGLPIWQVWPVSMTSLGVKPGMYFKLLDFFV